MKSQNISTAMSPGLNSTVRSTTDLELVRRAQGGDSEAFAALFHAHKAKIYSICLRMTGNTAQAEDLTQDAFMQVLRKLSTFQGNSALSTWLYRVAVNTVLMHFRKKALMLVSLDETSSHDSTLVRRERDNDRGTRGRVRWAQGLRVPRISIVPLSASERQSGLVLRW